MVGQGLEPTSALGVGGSPKAPIITLSLCTSNSVRKNDGRKWWSKGLLEVCAQNEVVGHIVICQLTTQHRPGQEAAIYAADCFVSGIKVIFFSAIPSNQSCTSIRLLRLLHGRLAVFPYTAAVNWVFTVFFFVVVFAELVFTDYSVGCGQIFRDAFSH